MKKLFALLLTAVLVLSLCACGGNFGKVDLQEPIAIPEDGIIDESVVAQIKSENAIGVFTGTAGEFDYEWTIWGRDIAEAKGVNLAVEMAAEGEELRVKLGAEEAFGFPALLSIYLDGVWDAQSATAYAGDTAAASVSLTGSSRTILNLTTDGTLGEVIIRPDGLPQEETTVVVTEEKDNKGGAVKVDDYLSPVTESDDKVYRDQYMTEEIPAGKPEPVEPEDQTKGGAITCTFSIECATILNNLDMLDGDKLEMVPTGGIILPATTVTCYEGESVFDALQRLCREKGIHMESSWTPIYNSAYVEGIHNLYEFDCGALSGWMYRVNGWYPNYGCSRYVLEDGDTVEWRYTCDLGGDIGGGYLFR